jgi:hypothetical protein
MVGGLVPGGYKIGGRRCGGFALLALLFACTPAEFDPEDGGPDAGSGDISVEHDDVSDVDDIVSSGAGGADGGASDPDNEREVGPDGNQVDTSPGEVGEVATDQANDADLATDGAADDRPDGADATNGDSQDTQNTNDGPDGALGVTPTLPGQLLVSEVLYDAVLVADDFGEWIEIYNPSPEVTYDLRGCAIVDIKNHAATITSSVLLPPGSYRTFARSAPGGLPTNDPGFVPDYVYPSVKFDNDAPEAVIVRCGEVIVDRFMYDPRIGLSGHALGVDPAHLRPGDNNLPGSYCPAMIPYHIAADQSTADYGTPGKINPPCPQGR